MQQIDIQDHPIKEIRIADKKISSGIPDLL